MRLRILSDLHLEISPFIPPPVDADVTILAGDIYTKRRAYDWITTHFKGPVIYVAGNHEFYGDNLYANIDWHRKNTPPNVHFLDGNAVTIDGYTFLGGTLWTDFDYDGDFSINIQTALRYMNDYHLIKVRDACGKTKKLIPYDTVKHHQRTLRSFEDYVECGPERLIMVTHHAPHPNSIHPDFKHENLNAAYVSDLTSFIEKANPRLWVHGHTHSSTYYHVGNTPIICNPRGYSSTENPLFNPSLVIDV